MNPTKQIRNKKMKKFKIYNKAQATEGKAKASNQKQSTSQTETGTKTVSVKVPGDVYDRLKQIRSEQGFKSVYEILQLLIVSFIRHTDRAQQKKAQQLQDVPQPIAEEIAEMFSQLTDSEPTPWKESKPTAHKPRKGILYN